MHSKPHPPGLSPPPTTPSVRHPRAKTRGPSQTACLRRQSIWVAGSSPAMTEPGVDACVRNRRIRRVARPIFTRLSPPPHPPQTPAFPALSADRAVSISPVLSPPPRTRRILCSLRRSQERTRERSGGGAGPGGGRVASHQADIAGCRGGAILPPGSGASAGPSMARPEGNDGRWIVPRSRRLRASWSS